MKKLLPMEQQPRRECPGCACEVPSRENRCPICGYEFPVSRGLGRVSGVLGALMLAVLLAALIWGLVI